MSRLHFPENPRDGAHRIRVGPMGGQHAVPLESWHNHHVYHQLTMLLAKIGIAAAFDEPLSLPIGFEGIKRYVAQHTSDTFDRFNNIS